MANDAPAFQFYPRDFLADPHVNAMTAEEVGGYLLLLCAAWQTDRPGYLPNDQDLLARLARLDRRKWARAGGAIMRALKTSEDGRWVFSKRMVAEREKQLAFREQASAAGRASATARAQRKANARSTTVDLLLGSRSNETPTDTPTEFNSAICDLPSASASAEEPEEAHTHTARARVKAPGPGDRVTLPALWEAWKKAGLGPMQDGSGMEELRRAFNAEGCDADPFACCRAWKRIAVAWRRNMPTAGEGPLLMLKHLDKVQLVVSGEMDPDAVPARAADRGQVPVARGLDYSNGGAKP